MNYYTSRYVAAADAVYPAASVGDAAGIPALNNSTTSPQHGRYLRAIQKFLEKVARPGCTWLLTG